MLKLIRIVGFCLPVVSLAACGVAVDQASLPQTKAPQVKASSEDIISSSSSLGKAADTGTSLASGGQNAASSEDRAPATNSGLIIRSAGEEVESDPNTLEMAQLSSTLAPSIDRLLEDQTDSKLPDENIEAEISDTEVAAEPSDLGTDDAENGPEDIVGNIIWNLETAQKNKPTPPSEPEIPIGQDPSLASEALEAAFAMLAGRQSVPAPSGFRLPQKSPGVTRIALLVPRSGSNAILGDELVRGAELALFSVRNANIQLVVLDTAGGPEAATAANQAVNAGADLMIGPLFSQAVLPAQGVAAQSGIPMLALSNNVDVAASGSWLLGYLPEQQIDLLLGHALTVGGGKVGILAEDSSFGQRLAQHAGKRLGQFGMRPEASLTLNAAQLASEDDLKQAIRDFTGYKPPDDDEDKPAASDLPPPRFDAVLFAGSADFALRVAPVLAYYDADPERVLYLGNAQWNQRRILIEPSLQGGLFASRPTGLDENFNALWTSAWPGRPGALARLSFDAVAMASVLASQDPQTWNTSLVSGSGFNGFSGAYRLLPNGGNQRAFELRQVSGGVSTLVQPAPDKI